MAEQPMPVITLDSLLRFPLRMTEEVLQLPDTLRDLRLAVHDLGRVTHEVAEATAAVNELAAIVRTADLPGLSRRVSGTVDRLAGEVGGIIDPLGRTLASVDRLDDVTTDLRDTISALVGMIPGARRALSSGAPPAKATPAKAAKPGSRSKRR